MTRVQAPSIPSYFYMQLGICLAAMLEFLIPNAAQAQSIVTAHLFFNVPFGHIDDCPNPNSGCTDYNDPTQLGTDGVRNTIPAGVAAFIEKLLHSGGSTPLTMNITTPTDYLVAEAVAGYSSLMFARRIAEAKAPPPVANYRWVIATFTVSITPTTSMKFYCTKPATDLCVDINLQSVNIPISATDKTTYLKSYRQAQEVLDAFASTF